MKSGLVLGFGASFEDGALARGCDRGIWGWLSPGFRLRLGSFHPPRPFFFFFFFFFVPRPRVHVRDFGPSPWFWSA